MVLIHHPVLDRKGKVIVSAITNLDVHDIARTALTYGVKLFYIVTPLKSQIKFVNKIIMYWTSGSGANHNPSRCDAIKIIRVKSDYDSVLKEIKNIEGRVPWTVATTARFVFRSKTHCIIRDKIITSCNPCVFTFGTAWGLTMNFIDNVDYVLSPIRGYDFYNHLSVRSAVSIIFDRILR